MTAKTDRELLELAAKAAGADFEYDPMTDAIEILSEIGGVSGIWNPLTDDGDTLRLAVALGISIDFEDCGAWKRLPNHKLIQEYWGGDYPDSYKHAIVRAAAAIGETL